MKIFKEFKTKIIEEIETIVQIPKKYIKYLLVLIIILFVYGKGIDIVSFLYNNFYRPNLLIAIPYDFKINRHHTVDNKDKIKIISSLKIINNGRKNNSITMADLYIRDTKEEKTLLTNKRNLAKSNIEPHKIYDITLEGLFNEKSFYEYQDESYKVTFVGVHIRVVTEDGKTYVSNYDIATAQLSKGYISQGKPISDYKFGLFTDVIDLLKNGDFFKSKPLEKETQKSNKYFFTN